MGKGTHICKKSGHRNCTEAEAEKRAHPGDLLYLAGEMTATSTEISARQKPLAPQNR